MGLFCLPTSQDPIGWLENALANLNLYARAIPKDPEESDVGNRRLDYLVDFVRHDIERTLEKLKEPT